MRWKEEPVIYMTRIMWRFSEIAKVIKFCALFLVAGLIDFLHPLAIAWLVNTIQQEGITNLPKILGIILVGLAIGFFFWVFHGPGRVVERKNAFHVRARFKRYLLRGIMSLPAAWHSANHSGDTIDKVKRSTDALYEYSENVFDIIYAILKIAFSFVALAYFNIHSAYIVVIMSYLAFTVILRYDKTLIPQLRRLDLAENRIAAKIYDSISNITTVLILKLERLVEKQVWKKILSPFSLFSKRTELVEWKWFFVSMCARGMIILVLGSFVVSTYVKGETILLGTLFALYDYVTRINGVFYHFAYKYGKIVEQKTKIDNVRPIMDLFSEADLVVPARLTKKWKELHIDDLRFSYHGKEGDMHLKDVSLTIAHGEKIALIGESGSGKTTFLKLLRGLYKPRKATVHVDNKLVSQGFAALQEHITLIPQEPELFATTVHENLTMGLDYPIKTIRKYVKLAQFSSVVRRLPKKYQSSIVEKGVNLSGGEKQRLALARGLLASADKHIVLLDEPTSSVDARNEVLIYENTFRTFKKKTVISSIHRLNLLYLFDTIYVFKKGKIVASGNLRQLKRNSKEFQRMWKKYKKK